MLDFSFTQGSLFLSFYCLSLFAILIFVNYSRCTYLSHNRNYTSRQRTFFLIGVALFAVSCFINGDFYNYETMVHNYDFTTGARNHGEPVYGYIIKLVHQNYLLFRIIVWGGSLLLLVEAISMIRLDVYKVVFYLIASYILTFSYARATLAFSFYYLGISFLCTPYKRGLITRVAGIILVLSSYFFHHSMVVAIVITPIIFLPSSKRILVYSIVLIPILFALLSGVINSFMAGEGIMDGDELAGQLSFYAERASSTANWKGKIYEWTNYLTYFIPLCIIIYHYYLKNNRTFPFYIDAFLKLAFSLTLISIMFLFLDIEGKIFFYRVLYMSFIPLSIVIYYAAINNYIRRKTYLLLLFIGLCAQMYRFFYNIYLFI